ncbi:hypothetical protein [Maridesulfovibrio sp.]|uniref:hypothetical protein n=1 Tax=Maridesulfovibrio sp. TaxID=2795000 RepID=UPI002A1899CF|nr:hypothetical protein [Maridesulfovibrio sp.]
MQAERVDDSLRESYDRCQKWVASDGVDIDDEIVEEAVREAERGTLFCQKNGMTNRMQTVCTAHVRDSLGGFQQVYSEFMLACSPYIEKIRQVTHLEERYRMVDDEVDQKIRDEERTLKSTAGYDEACIELDEAVTHYRKIRQSEGNRVVTLRPFWLYVILLSLVAVGEVMINYNFLLKFMDIPAFALATSAAIGGVVAWASHEHGRALKQFTFYFGSHVRPEEKKHVGWHFAVATMFLAVVFVAVYYVRYIAVVNANANMMVQLGNNILDNGYKAGRGMGPTAAALTSLGSNVAVWGLSIWISTMFHDRNPHYMEAALQKKKAEARLNKITKTRNANVNAYNAGRSVGREEVRNEIKALTEDLGEQLQLYKQVQAKRDKIISQMVNETNRNLVLYKQTLMSFLSSNGSVKIYGEGNEPISYDEYDRMNVSADENYIMQLIRW